MIAQHSLQRLITSEPKHRRHPVARLLGPLHTSRPLSVGRVIPILLVAAAVLIGGRWSTAAIAWGNGSTSIQTLLPPPAPNAGNAAWTRYYRSFDPIKTRVVIATITMPMPQPRALPADPTRPVTAPEPTPVATPRPSAADQTR